MHILQDISLSESDLRNGKGQRPRVPNLNKYIAVSLSSGSFFLKGLGIKENPAELTMSLRGIESTKEAFPSSTRHFKFQFGWMPHLLEENALARV